MAAPAGSSRLQQMLQSAVQSVQWTYSLFWQLCPQQGILVWGDGYYNGAIKTRKTVQPMEVTAEEASLQRSQQLRELYDSLSADETDQPARRPCAALSPEDLTESEWFYLMSISFSFPHGVGLPGKASARLQHVWLLGANEADSKVFSRAILAKSAGVQTVLCLPLMDGVVELGTTERVQEDLGLIQHVKTFFIDHHHPNPALSEHSITTTASNRSRFHSPPLLAVYTAAHPPINDEEDEEEEEEEDHRAESDSEVETGRLSQRDDPIAQDIVVAQPSELMQLDMSEDIRLGSPDDASNHLDSYQPDLQNRPESTPRWPLLPDPLDNNGLQLAVSEDLHQIEELMDEQYSQTVSTILEQGSAGRWSDSSAVDCIGYSPQSSAFSNWRFSRSDPLRADGTSQWLLKCVLFTVPFLHNNCISDEKSPRSEIDTKIRKSASQDELSANHVLAERRRREKLNERFIILRSLVPFVTKMDKASILGDAIEYVKQLRRRIQDLESTTLPIDGDQRSGEADAPKIGGAKEQRITMHGSDRRKIRVVEGHGGAKAKVVEGAPIVGNVVQVSIIESDALLELKCGYREGMLLEIMQTLRELRMEITAVQSSSNNCVFTAELRAKVKENSSGRKVTIVEVKRVIHQIISHVPSIVQ